jgi:hypothetical protein
VALSIFAPQLVFAQAHAAFALNPLRPFVPGVSAPHLGPLGKFSGPLAKKVQDAPYSDSDDGRSTDHGFVSSAGGYGGGGGGGGGSKGFRSGSDGGGPIGQGRPYSDYFDDSLGGGPATSGAGGAAAQRLAAEKARLEDQRARLAGLRPTGSDGLGEYESVRGLPDSA